MARNMHIKMMITRAAVARQGERERERERERESERERERERESRGRKSKNESGGWEVISARRGKVPQKQRLRRRGESKHSVSWSRDKRVSERVGLCGCSYYYFLFKTLSEILFVACCVV